MFIKSYYKKRLFLIDLFISQQLAPLSKIQFVGPQPLQTITKSKMEVFRNKSFTEIARAQQHKVYSICAISISKSSVFMSDITLHDRSDITCIVQTKSVRNTFLYVIDLLCYQFINFLHKFDLSNTSMY